MVMCDSSLGALNDRLNEPVECINFRPNIMIEGTEPFDEVTFCYMLRFARYEVDSKCLLCTLCGYKIFLYPHPKRCFRGSTVFSLSVIPSFRNSF